VISNKQKLALSCPYGGSIFRLTTPFGAMLPLPINCDRQEESASSRDIGVPLTQRTLRAFLWR